MRIHRPVVATIPDSKASHCCQSAFLEYQYWVGELSRLDLWKESAVVSTLALLEPLGVGLFYWVLAIQLMALPANHREADARHD